MWLLILKYSINVLIGSVHLQKNKQKQSPFGLIFLNCELPGNSNQSGVGLFILKMAFICFCKLTLHMMFACAGICVGNTDSRHFKDLTNDIYRFAPVWFKPGDAQR